MSDYRRIAPLRGHSFGRSIGAWRIAQALRAEAYREPAPSVTIEAGPEYGPWDDIVEQWDSGAVHVWQVKAGTEVGRRDLEQLIRKLALEMPKAKATLACRMNARVPGLSGGLGELDHLLCAAREGASRGVEKPSSWKDFLKDSCGSESAAESVCRRLHVVFLGSLEAPHEWTNWALGCIYETDVVPAVRDRLLAVVDATVGSKISAESLRQMSLREFEEHRRATLPARIESVRARYLRTLRDALCSRRVLRGIRKDGVKLSQVWVDIRMSTPSGDEFGAASLVDLLREGMLHLLLAPAGGGKTEILARTGAALAALATASTEAAVPLLVPASTLRDGTDQDLATNSEAFASGTGPLLEQLLKVPNQRWILLIDGVDEVQEGAEKVDALQRRFPGATIVAAARPTVGRALAPAVTFTLEPWSVSESEVFMRGMVAAHPEATEALQALSAHAGSLLDRPLTASLAVLAALHDDQLPANRGQIFRAAVPWLVESWAARRSGAHRWDAVADDIRRLALEFVRGERQRISSSELRSFAQRAAPDRSATVRLAAEDDLGLLVPVPGGHEFLVRGLAEHLAGEFVARDDNEVLEAARSSWGEETARHALSGLAESHPDRFVGIVRRILSSLESTSDCALGALRAFLVAIRTAADVGADATRIAAELSGWCCTFLDDECSPWRADRVGDAVAELAAAGGPCWDEIRRHLIAILSDPRQPKDYYAALEDHRPATWLLLLFHCDPAVRGIAIRRLARHTDDSTVVDRLVTMLLDDPAFEVMCVPPAIEAGLALRIADRGGRLGEYLDVLRKMSEGGGQLSAAAAATALRPTEHEPGALARALRHGADGGYVTEEVLKELALVPKGDAALALAWPDWRAYRSRQPPLDDSPDGRLPVPPSRWVRRRSIRAATAAIARDRALAEVLDPALTTGAKALYLNSLCEGGLLGLDAAIELLDISPARFPLLSHKAQDVLASAAIRHTAVRAKIVDAWQRFGNSSHAMLFPGKALEQLVVTGDLEAMQVYSDWLPRSQHAVGIFAGQSPDPRVFERPEVRAAGRDIVDRTWRVSTEGKTDPTGQRVAVAKTSVATVLRHFSPCWRGNDTITNGLLKWLGTDDLNSRLAGISGLERAQLSTSQQGEMLHSLRRLFTCNEHVQRLFSFPSAVMLARRHGLVSQLLPEIAPLTEEDGPIAFPAACAASLVVSAAEARSMSEKVASRKLQLMAFDGINHEDVAAFVALAPDEWANGLVRQFQRSGPLVLGTMLPLYGALPLSQRRAVAQKLSTMAEGFDLPWCSTGIVEETYRPLDLVQQLLFDCGLRG